MPFDIRADIAEIPRETEQVSEFTFEIALAKKVKDLRAAPELDEAAIAEAETQLKAATYVAQIHSVPRGQREDIYAESLDKFPAKPSVFGQDEKANFLRGNFVRVAIVAAAIDKITNPKGEVNDTEELILATVEYLHNEAPDQIFAKIERDVNALNEKEDAQDVLHKSADF